MQITNMTGNMVGAWGRLKMPAQSFDPSNNFEHYRLQSVSVKNSNNVFKTSCSYQMSDEKNLIYHTYYEKDRIYCQKDGTDGYEWEIPLDHESQYNRVLSFLNGLKNKENQSFTIHNTFWKDFLSGKLNAKEFKEYLNSIDQETSANGFKISENGTFNDEGMRKYSCYLYGPSFGANMIRTTEEFAAWQNKQLEKAQDKQTKNYLHWSEQWSLEHPRLAGLKCIRHSDGQCYTAEEIEKLWEGEVSVLFSRN